MKTCKYSKCKALFKPRQMWQQYCTEQCRLSDNQVKPIGPKKKGRQPVVRVQGLLFDPSQY